MDNLMKRFVIGMLFSLCVMNASGQTWQTVQNGVSNAVSDAYTTAGYRIYVAVGEILYVSKDKGESFTPLQIGNSGIIQTAYSSGDYVVVGCDNDGVYISSDRGNTWNKVSNSVAGTNVTLTSLITSNFIFVGSGQQNQGIIRLSKLGSFENRKLTDETRILCLAEQGQYIFVGVNRTDAETGKSTLYRSSDNGNSWQPLTHTIRQNVPITALAVSGDQSVIYAVSGQDINGTQPKNGYVYKSTDNGNTWTEIQIPQLSPSSNAFYAIALGYGKDTVLIGRVGVSGSGTSQVWRSVNGGSNWSPLDNTFNADGTKVTSLLITNAYYFACRDRDNGHFHKYINYPKPVIRSGKTNVLAVCSDRDTVFQIITEDRGLNDTYTWYRVEGGEKVIPPIKNGNTLSKTEMNCRAQFGVSCDYRCIVTNNKNLQDSADYKITFYQKPTVKLQDTTNKTNVCADKEYEYGIAPTANTYSFQWSVIGGKQVGRIVGDSTKETVNVRWFKPGKLSVKEIATDGSKSVKLCEDVKEITIKVRDVKPDITNTSIVKKGTKKEVSICQGESLIFQTLKRLSNTYTWFLDGSQQQVTANDYTFNGAVAKEKEYVVRVRESNGDCSEEDSVFITVKKLPDTSIIGNTTLCRSNLTTDYTANEKDALYAWEVKGGKINNGKDKQKVNIEWFDNTQDKSLTLMVTKNGCTEGGEWKIFITDSLKPQTPRVKEGKAQFITNTLYKCEKEQSVIVQAQVNDQGSYEWRKGNIIISQKDTLVCKEDGEYTLKVTNNNCSGSYTFIVKTKDIPKPTIQQNEDRIVITNLNTLPKNLKYQWRKGSAIVGDKETYTPNEDGSYSLEIIDENGLCSKESDPITFTRPKKFEITFEENFDGKFCNNEDIKLTVIPKNNNGKTVKYNCNEAIATENETGIFSFNRDKFVNNILSVRIIASITENDKDTIQKDLQIIDFTSNEIKGSRSVCTNTRNDYNIESSATADSYRWRIEPTTAADIDDATKDIVNVTWKKDGKLFCTQMYGECTFVDSIDVKVGDNFEVPIKGENLLCSTRPSITLTIDGSFQTMEWKKDNSILGKNNSLTITQSGTYTVTVSSSNGCKGEGIFTIENLKTPSLKRNGDYLICSNATDYDNVIWLNGDKEISTQPEFKPQDEGVYVCKGSKDGCEEEEKIEFKRRFVIAKLSSDISAPGDKVVLLYTFPDNISGTIGTIQWNKNVLNFTGVAQGITVRNTENVVDSLVFDINSDKAEIEYEVLIGPDTSTNIVTTFVPSFNTDTPRLTVSTCDITGKKRLLSWKNKPDEIQLRVIPNPATQSFTVLSSKNTVVKGKIHIINSMGEVVKITTITEEGGGIIHTESLLPGFYAIEVYTGTEVLHSTVIIHK